MSRALLRPADGILSIYRDSFARYGRDERALCWSKGKQDVRFAALCASVADTPSSLLDFGCGLGDLAAWLSVHRPQVNYTGADAMAEFVADNQRHMPQYRFIAVDGARDIRETFDHIVCCGVFNLDPGKDAHRHWGYVRDTIAHLFTRTRIALHVDFLAHDVDYRQAGAYHQDLGDLLAYVECGLSKRYILNRSYMPYEYCISIFAARTLDLARNVYGPA